MPWICIMTRSKTMLTGTMAVSHNRPQPPNEKQGRIHGQYQLRTGGQGQKCAFSHFSTRAHGPDRWMDGRTDKTSYGVACSQLKTYFDSSLFRLPSIPRGGRGSPFWSDFKRDSFISGFSLENHSSKFGLLVFSSPYNFRGEEKEKRTRDREKERESSR